MPVKDKFMPAIVRRNRERRKHRRTVALFSQAENMWRTEIERLREELKQSIDREAFTYFRAKRMEVALRKIMNYGPGITHGWATDVRRIARRELEGET